MASVVTGRVREKVVPCHSTLATITRPPCAAITSCTNIEAQACPPVLGRIQGLKDLRQLVSRHAFPRIPDLELYVGGSALASQGERPTLGHGVQGVLHQVEEGAPERVRMHSHRCQLRQTFQAKRHPTSVCQPLPLLRPRLHCC